MQKESAFWGGFEKAAADAYGSPALAQPESAEAASPGGGPTPAGAKPKVGTAPDPRLMKWNPAGGVDPRSPEDMSAAQAVDLITLPDQVDGTNCSNCKFVRILDPGLGTAFCTNPQVKQDVTSRMCCALWDAPGTYRAWEATDPSAVPHPGMMQEAQALEQSGMPMAASAEAGPVGGTPEPQPREVPSSEKPESKEKKPAPKKKAAGGHTINVNVGGQDEESEKKAFWGGFGKQAAGTSRADRLINALRSKPKLLSDAHAAARKVDLQQQARGLIKHKETSLLKATESAKKTQAAGGFKGSKV